MASPKIAKDIRDYLVATVGLSNVSIGMLASTPVNQYAVIEYSGPANIKTHGVGTAVLDEGLIQILARHASANTALTNIQAVVDALDGLRDVTINGVVYQYMTEISRPRIMERDESGAIIYCYEMRIHARR